VRSSGALDSVILDANALVLERALKARAENRRLREEAKTEAARTRTLVEELRSVRETTPRTGRRRISER